MSDENIPWVRRIEPSEIQAFHDQTCRKHVLFLNYALGHFADDTQVDPDYFPLSIFFAPDDPDKPYHVLSYLAEIKDTYVLARTLFVKAQVEEVDFAFENISWDDRVVFFTDYRVGFDFNVETMKLAFSTAYRVFDKIAFLIHEYLGGTLPERRINFNSIFDSKKGLHLQHRFPHLLALFDIHLDFQEKLPRVVELRNSLAHKYLVVHRPFEPHQIKKPLQREKMVVPDPKAPHSRENPVNFHMTDDELFEVALGTLKLARSALIYTTRFINEHEHQIKQNGYYVPFRAPKI